MIWRHEAAKLLDQGKSNRQIAEALGKNQRTVERWRAAYTKGRDKPQPSLTMTGKSTLQKIDEDGNKTAILVWEKENLTRANLFEQEKAAIGALIEPIRGLANPVESPRDCAKRLLNIVVYGDPHVGLYSWAPESGGDYDLKIAEATMLDTTRALCPRTESPRVLDYQRRRFLSR